MKHVLMLIILTSNANAQPAIWLPNVDTGCGYRSNPMDAESVADWLECQVAGLDAIKSAAKFDAEPCDTITAANASICDPDGDIMNGDIDAANDSPEIFDIVGDAICRQPIALGAKGGTTDCVN